jgi:hypothetical protein
MDVAALQLEGMAELRRKRTLNVKNAAAEATFLHLCRCCSLFLGYPAIAAQDTTIQLNEVVSAWCLTQNQCLTSLITS